MEKLKSFSVPSAKEIMRWSGIPERWSPSIFRTFQSNKFGQVKISVLNTFLLLSFLCRLAGRFCTVVSIAKAWWKRRPRRGREGLRNSWGPSLAPLSPTSWRKETRNRKSERPKGQAIISRRTTSEIVSTEAVHLPRVFSKLLPPCLVAIYLCSSPTFELVLCSPRTLSNEYLLTNANFKISLQGTGGSRREREEAGKGSKEREEAGIWKDS